MRSRRISMAPVGPAVEGDALARHVRLTVEAQGHRGLELDGHARQGVEVLVGVPPHAEVDLPERIEPVGPQHLEQHADLHAVAGHERQPQHGSRTNAHSPASGWVKPRRRGSTRRSKRPRDQLGDPSATPARRRPVVEALDQDERRVTQDRIEQADDEAGSKSSMSASRYTPIVSGHPGQAGLHRPALAAVATTRSDPVDHGAGPGRAFRRRVGRAGVDHDDLVHEPGLLDELLADRLDDGADRRLLVACRQHHADATSLEQSGDVARVVGGREGAAPEPRRGLACVRQGLAPSWTVAVRRRCLPSSRARDACPRRRGCGTPPHRPTRPAPWPPGCPQGVRRAGRRGSRR